jgi:hypothetical protein
MTKRIKYVVLVGIVAFTATVIVAFLLKEANQSAALEKQEHHLQAPAKMIDMGPVATDINSTEQIGDISIKMTASRFWIKKTKTFGFDNGLFKKLAAKNFCLTISKAGKEILCASKDMVELPIDRGVIIIDRPKIISPQNMEQPDSIRFDRSKMLLLVRKGTTEKTWDLLEN